MSIAGLEQKISYLPIQYVTEIEDFIDFLVSKYSSRKADENSAEKVSCFGALKHKISFISADFDEPLDDFKDYM